MEPCTLWGKFLVEEREEWAFSEPQVRACMGQQPGALNSERALQPLPTTGLEEEAASQPDIQMASASWLLSDGAALTGDTMLLSGLVGAEQNLTQAAEADFCTDPARNKQEITAFAVSIEGECGSPPKLPCRHQRCFGHHHHAIDQVAGQVVVDIFPKERYVAAPELQQIPVEVGAPEPFEADKDEKGAVLKYTDTWLRTTSTERRECVSSLVGRALVTDSTPGSTSHAHFLAAMVADYVKEKSINFEPVFPGTPAHMGKSHRGSQHRASRRSRDARKHRCQS